MVLAQSPRTIETMSLDRSGLEQIARPIMKEFSETLGYSNVYLISSNGTILFALNEGFPVGARLKDGTLRSSELTRAFDEAASHGETVGTPPRALRGTSRGPRGDLSGQPGHLPARPCWGSWPPRRRSRSSTGSSRTTRASAIRARSSAVNSSRRARVPVRFAAAERPDGDVPRADRQRWAARLADPHANGPRKEGRLRGLPGLPGRRLRGGLVVHADARTWAWSPRSTRTRRTSGSPSNAG